MKLLLTIIVAAIAVSIVEARYYECEAETSIRFVDYFSEVDLFQASIANNIPIILLKKIVAGQLGTELKNVLLFRYSKSDDDLELKDGDTLDKYNIGTSPVLRVIVAKAMKYDFVDIETDKSLATFEVNPLSKIADVKVALASRLELEGAKIHLYFGQHELKDEQIVCTIGIQSDDKMVVYIEK